MIIDKEKFLEYHLLSMLEAMGGPDNLRKAVGSLMVELSKRRTDRLQGDLEIIGGKFPQVVEDSQRLWEALSDDDLADLTRDKYSQDPSTFVFQLMDPDPYFGTHHSITWQINGSPNKDLYKEIYQKYIYITEDEGDKEEHAFLTDDEKARMDLRDLFDLSFKIVREISHAPQVLGSTLNP